MNARNPDPSARWRVLAPALVAGVALGAACAASADSHEMPFGQPAEVAYSKTLWAALEQARLAGPDAYGTVPYTGQHPHGAVLETLYGRVEVDGREGDVIVKRNYGGEDVGNLAVARDRAKYLKAVTVMFRREKGYDPEANDWFWVKYTPDGGLHTNPKGAKLAGQVARGVGPEGGAAGCIGCHGAMESNDFQFNTSPDWEGRP